MSEFVTARVTQTFGDLKSDQVFDAWIRPDLLRDWMSKPLAGSTAPTDIRKVETDPRIGGRFEFADMREDGLARAFGTYLVVDRPRELAFTWFTSEEEARDDHSVVRMAFQDTEQDCNVVLSHEMSAIYADYLRQTEAAWRHMLGNIGEVLAG